MCVLFSFHSLNTTILFRGFTCFIVKVRIRNFRNVNERKNLNMTDLLWTWYVISLLFKHVRVNKEAYDMTDIYETSFHLAFPFVSCRQTVCCCCGMWRFGKLTSGYLCLFRADSRLPALCDLSFTSVVFVTWE